MLSLSYTPTGRLLSQLRSAVPGELFPQPESAYELLCMNRDTLSYMWHIHRRLHSQDRAGARLNKLKGSCPSHSKHYDVRSVSVSALRLEKQSATKS